jgi:flagellar motility protein MotE (MotC chaperone)
VKARKASARGPVASLADAMRALPKMVGETSTVKVMVGEKVYYVSTVNPNRVPGVLETEDYLLRLLGDQRCFAWQALSSKNAPLYISTFNPEASERQLSKERSLNAEELKKLRDELELSQGVLRTERQVRREAEGKLQEAEGELVKALKRGAELEEERKRLQRELEGADSALRRAKDELAKVYAELVEAKHPSVIPELPF